MLATAITVHILSVLVWIGGMFFAHFVLRPVANQLLDVPTRLAFMSQLFTQFFPWVWGAIVCLWVSGLWLIFGFRQGLGNVAISVHIMLTLALIMTVLFIYIVFIPFPRLKHAVKVQDFKEGGQHLGIIRRLVATNLFLGLTITITALLGRYL